jgi:hypothetical protein
MYINKHHSGDILTKFELLSEGENKSIRNCALLMVSIINKISNDITVPEEIKNNFSDVHEVIKKDCNATKSDESDSGDKKTPQSKFTGFAFTINVFRRTLIDCFQSNLYLSKIQPFQAVMRLINGAQPRENDKEDVERFIGSFYKSLLEELEIASMVSKRPAFTEP